MILHYPTRSIQRAIHLGFTFIWRQETRDTFILTQACGLVVGSVEEPKLFMMLIVCCETLFYENSAQLSESFQRWSPYKMS